VYWIAFSALTLLVGRQEGFISSCSVRMSDNNNDDDHDDNNNVQLLTYLVSVDKKDESHVQMKMKKNAKNPCCEVYRDTRRTVLRVAEAAAV